MNRNAIAASVLQPHFDAVRDVFLAFRPAHGSDLAKLAKTKFLIDPKVHDTKRHHAAARDDGRLLIFAPELADLDIETIVAIISHEFGHASDFAYPAHWLMPPGGPGKATWIGDARGADKKGAKAHRQWAKLWEHRSRDQVEWAADGIAQAVTGKKLTYCGDCMLQCFSGGVERHAGLR